jgi:hypothetical protein
MNYTYRFDSDKTLHVIHEDTGVVLVSIPKGGIGREKEPAYTKFYFGFAGYLAEKFNGKAAVFFYLLSLCGKDGEIVLRKRQRDDIAHKVGLSVKTVFNYVSQLLADGLLCKMPGETGPIYWINPKFFAVGTWDDVKERSAVFEVARRLAEDPGCFGDLGATGVSRDGVAGLLSVEPHEGAA